MSITALFTLIFVIEILCAYHVVYEQLQLDIVYIPDFPFLLQEEELEQMAALMNAQFQEIDKVNLVVE